MDGVVRRSMRFGPWTRRRNLQRKNLVSWGCCWVQVYWVTLPLVVCSRGCILSGCRRSMLFRGSISKHMHNLIGLIDKSLQFDFFVSIWCGLLPFENFPILADERAVIMSRSHYISIYKQFIYKQTHHAVVNVIR